MSGACHYCGKKATTRDHIVPRCMIPKDAPSTLLHDNTVPACAPCNQQKGASRSTCECDRCESAWYRIAPWDWAVPVVAVGRRDTLTPMSPLR